MSVLAAIARRPIAALLALTLALTACVRPSLRPVAHVSSHDARVVAVVDLPADDPRRVELSDLAWDAATQTLYAVSDHAPFIVALRPGPGFRSWTIVSRMPVRFDGPWDGEGLALAPRSGGFYLANETGPRVYRIGLDGSMIGEVQMPVRLRRARENHSIESLTVSPDDRYLFVANEAALRGDGTTGNVHEGTTVRIVRRDLANGEIREAAYRTEPVFIGGHRGANGVSAMAALSATELLVLERAYVPGVGNAARIFRVDMGRIDILAGERLHEDSPVMTKRLVLDLAALPDTAASMPLEPQPTRLLANYEGLALGPLDPDGMRLLFLVSDDNADPRQSARLLVLAARL